MDILHFNQDIAKTNDVFLRYLVMYKASDGRTRFTDGNMRYFYSDNGKIYINTVLLYLTDYVKSNILHLEVALPERSIDKRPTGHYTSFLVAA